MRLTQQEFEESIANLYQTEYDESILQRRELELTIDHRLGTEFPIDRREQLWEVCQNIERSRLRFAVKWLTNVLTSRLRRRQSTKLAQVVIDEYAKVLTTQELIMYFGRDATENPSLP